MFANNKQPFNGILRGCSLFFYFCHVYLTLFIVHRFLKSPHMNASYWAIVRPTNGAFTLFVALQTCDTVS